MLTISEPHRFQMFSLFFIFSPNNIAPCSEYWQTKSWFQTRSQLKILGGDKYSDSDHWTVREKFNEQHNFILDTASQSTKRQDLLDI